MRRTIVFALLVVFCSAVWLLVSCTSPISSTPESAMPKPEKIVVHFEGSESVTLDRTDPMFGSFLEASRNVVTSLNTLLPLLTPQEIVGDIKGRSTYVELVFSSPFRLSTGLVVPLDERGRYRVGVDIDEKGRRLIEPDNIVLFLTGIIDPENWTMC